MLLPVGRLLPLTPQRCICRQSNFGDAYLIVGVFTNIFPQKIVKDGVYCVGFSNFGLNLLFARCFLLSDRVTAVRDLAGPLLCQDAGLIRGD
jgi:hypothetical protein